ncbi:MAG: hypothetical protein KUG51_03015 [Urechidicola sp.]|nr:hypothetical protein [Urechidicola sp.]
MKKLLLLFVISVNVSLAQNEILIQPFSPDLFTDFPNVRDISITNDGSEMYFTVEGYKKEFSFIALSKKNKKGDWQQPQVVSFSGKDKDLEPFLSPDNLSLFFASNRSIDGTLPKTDFDIWVVKRKTLKSNWSHPVNLGAIINTDKDEFYPSVSNSGNLYYTATIDSDTKGKEDIYMSKFEEGMYTTPVSLSEAVNSETYEFNAFISPDESMLMYSSYRRPDGFGGVDMYISRKDVNGKWLPAKNMGDKINSKFTEYCPFLDFKNGTFYFTSDRSNQKPKFETQLSIEEILDEMNSSPNGLSRIYVLKFDESLFK